jgi:ACS family glucarate transporter-like MFS transporter
MTQSVRKSSHVRFLVVFALFAASTLSYSDRVVLSVAGPRLAKDLHLNSIQMGYLFSASIWAYVVAQIPAGYMLDRFGAKRIYAASLILWSMLATIAGLVGFLPGALIFGALFVVRLVSGLAQAPVFPGNGRIVAAWFPASERGTASAIFNSSQYFTLVLFGPIIGWLAQNKGWQSCFWMIGGLGLLIVLGWSRIIHNVDDHPDIAPSEVEHIRSGGGLCTIGGATGAVKPRFSLSLFASLLSNRLILGLYFGQFCINTLSIFFMTWFPVYLSQGRHIPLAKVGFIAAVPALCGSLGGLLGGVTSDALLRRTRSLNLARKGPIVAGMLLAVSLIACNGTDSQVLIVALMSFAFFGKGFGALGWTIVSDVSPAGLVGLNGGFFNLCGNIAGITTPIVIGYLVQKTGSFRLALDFVAVAAFGAIACFLLIAGDIHRLTSEEFFGNAHTVPGEQGS